MLVFIVTVNQLTCKSGIKVFFHLCFFAITFAILFLMISNYDSNVAADFFNKVLVLVFGFYDAGIHCYNQLVNL